MYISNFSLITNNLTKTNVIVETLLFLYPCHSAICLSVCLSIYLATCLPTYKCKIFSSKCNVKCSLFCITFFPILNYLSYLSILYHILSNPKPFIITLLYRLCLGVSMYTALSHKHIFLDEFCVICHVMLLSKVFKFRFRFISSNETSIQNFKKSCGTKRKINFKWYQSNLIKQAILCYLKL